MALLFSASAFAASKPSAYKGKAGSVQGVVQKGAHATKGTPVSIGATHNGGQLPFTGVDLAVFAAAAAGLVLVGYSLRRAGSPRV